MTYGETNVVVGNPPYAGLRYVRRLRWFIRPDLRLWSINLAEDQAPELTGQARADFEREARISQLGMLIEARCATPLWRRVCKDAMYAEIRGRSPDRRLAMELALQESMR